jgi:hypothetical protein
MEEHAAYLALLRQLSQELEQLSTLAREKTAAVRQDDLKELDRVLKQEQALSLSIRSLEQRRQKAVEALQLSNVSLSCLAGQYPGELRLEAKATVEELQRQYEVYRSVSQVARNTLECNLHEIEKALDTWGAEPAAGPGYGSGSVEPPSQLKTDIRA